MESIQVKIEDGMEQGNRNMKMQWILALIGSMIYINCNAQTKSGLEEVVNLNKVVVFDSTLDSLITSFIDSIEPIVKNAAQYGISMTIEWEKNQSLDSLRFIESVHHEEFPVSVYFSLYSAPTYVRARAMGVNEMKGYPIIVYSYPYECSEVVRTNSLYRWRYLDSKNLVLTLLAYYEVRLENGVWDVKHYINKVKGINRVYHTYPK